MASWYHVICTCIESANYRVTYSCIHVLATILHVSMYMSYNPFTVNIGSPQGVPALLVVTGTSFMVLDPKTMALKYRVELQYLKQVSLSGYSDPIVVMHIDPVNNSYYVTCTCIYSLLVYKLCKYPPTHMPTHTQYKATDRSYVKGDFMFKCNRCIEMVTKTHAIIQETLSKKLKIVIQNE